MFKKLKGFFEATRRFPGAGLYLGCGRYVGFKPSCDRYGVVVNLGFFWIMFITYDFISSSANIMSEYNKIKQQNAKISHIYGGRTPRRVK